VLLAEQFAFGMGDRLEHVAREFNQAHSRFSRCHLATAPHEELSPQSPLELLQLVAHRRLTQMQETRGSGNPTAFHNRTNKPQVSGFQAGFGQH
jgi:hypothetical protein